MRPLLSVLLACFALTSIAAAQGDAPAKARDVKAVVAELTGKGYGAIAERNGVIGYIGRTDLHGVTKIHTVERQRAGRLVETERLSNGGQRVSLWQPDGNFVQHSDASYRSLMGGPATKVALGSARNFDRERTMILRWGTLALSIGSSAH